ncbi:CaiB/BaiF CoA transferase family protein [Gordonia sp. NPDC003424]
MTTETTTPPQALGDVLIADFARVLAGPYATMLLADFGADVVKVERAGTGDDTRQWGPPWSGDEATYFQAVNRNKRSVAWDLRNPDHLEQARDLVARADIVIENFVPGAMSRLGLGHDQVRELNPDVIYCSVTGFCGDSTLPGYDMVIQAAGGLMSITGPGPGEPVKVGVALVDVITGLHATVGILAALRHRDRTGEGQRVEVNLLSSLLSALANQASAYVGAGVVSQALGNQHPSIAPYEVLETGDRPLALAVGNDRQFAALVTELGLAELATDERFTNNARRVANRTELAARLTGALKTNSADVWFKTLSSAGVPCGPINNIEEAMDLATSLGLEPIVEIDDPRRPTPNRQVANPIRLSATPATYRTAPPRLGER